NTNGALDTSFDTDGIVTAPLTINAVALQSDGKIVVAGISQNHFAAARFNTNGSLDTTFNGDLVTPNFGTSDSSGIAFDLALQKDGKIVVVGQTLTPAPAFTGDFAIARLNTNGTLDP